MTTPDSERARRGERFPRACRICQKRDFGRVFAHAREVPGRRVSHPALRIVFRPNEFDHPRLGLAVSRKVSKRAVVRNRIKRRLRELFRRNGEHVPPSVDLVVIAMPPMRDLGFQETREVFLELLSDCRRRLERSPPAPR